jgi:drug/metabolite transporter (DMT)-like permease
MIQLPIIGALLEATGMILEKKTLKGKKMNYKNYTVFEFLAIVVMSLPFLYFFWRADAGAFEFWNLFRLFFVVVFSVAANLLIFYSLKRENISEFEPLWLTQPLFTVLLAFIIYPGERNITIVALALIASLALVFSHIKKGHFLFDKYIIAALLGSFFFAVELVISKPLLDYYSPFTFYFLRCFFVLAICFALFRPSLGGQKIGTWLTILVIGLTWVLYRTILYYGYLSFGIVFTTILFILSPVFIFLFAAIFLKEKPTWKQIASAAIIVACVIAAIVLEG